MAFAVSMALSPPTDNKKIAPVFSIRFQILSPFRRESHLASVVTQENDDGCEKEHHDEINGI
jgi:hypothetical protein